MTFRPPQFVLAYPTSISWASGDWTDVSEVTTSFGDPFRLPDEKKYRRFALRCHSSTGSEAAVVNCTVGVHFEADNDGADDDNGAR